MTKTLNRDDILNALDLPMEYVEAPRWGGRVLVKAMPVGHPRYTLYVTGGSKQKGPVPAREEFTRRMVGAVIMSALDPETEKPMFTWDDADTLREKHWNTVVAIANKAFELAGPRPEFGETDEPEDSEDGEEGPENEERPESDAPLEEE
jgi:hypothetical protein